MTHQEPTQARCEQRQSLALSSQQLDLGQRPKRRGNDRVADHAAREWGDDGQLEQSRCNGKAVRDAHSAVEP